MAPGGSPGRSGTCASRTTPAGTRVARSRCGRSRRGWHATQDVSRCEAATLGYLDQAGRLKTPQRARGLIPGEAAVALVVAAGRAGPRAPVRSMECPILGIGHSIEARRVVDETPCLGDGLTAALRMAMGRIEWDAGAMGPTYCDLNGEDYRSNEWLLAACRTAVPDSLHHPADCIGDVGAASFLLLLGLAAADRRREGAEHALVWASSDFGARGAVCIGRLA